MKTLSLFALALVMGTGVKLARGNQPQSALATVTPDQASNAAFRDGLYQAKLAIERGSGPHIATGRWFSVADRAAFAAGYRAGYPTAQKHFPRASKAAVRA